MLTGALSAPVTALVAQSVVLYLKVAGIRLANEMPAPKAVLAPELMIVANAVAVFGICTERLAGRTAATSARRGPRLEMIRADPVAGLSVNQRLPSGPAVIPYGCAARPCGTGTR